MLWHPSLDFICYYIATNSICGRGSLHSNNIKSRYILWSKSTFFKFTPPRTIRFCIPSSFSSGFFAVRKHFLVYKFSSRSFHSKSFFGYFNIQKMLKHELQQRFFEKWVTLNMPSQSFQSNLDFVQKFCVWHVKMKPVMRIKLAGYHFRNLGQEVLSWEVVAYIWMSTNSKIRLHPRFTSKSCHTKVEAYKPSFFK